jgi:hypothetical protein
MGTSRKSRSKSTEPLTCPSCGLRHSLDERFCDGCGMPLVYAAGREVEARRSEAQRRARKIDPAYSEGDVVRVAGGRNQAEAELIQGMLLEEGIPSVLRRSAGFDVPDMLAAGPRDVLVPEAGAEAARQVLLDADMAPPTSDPVAAADERRHALLLVGAILGGGTVSALIAWALVQAG